MEMKPDSTPEPDVRIIGARRFSLSFVVWLFEDISLSCHAVRDKHLLRVYFIVHEQCKTGYLINIRT